MTSEELVQSSDVEGKKIKLKKRKKSKSSGEFQQHDSNSINDGYIDQKSFEICKEKKKKKHLINPMEVNNIDKSVEELSTNIINQNVSNIDKPKKKSKKRKHGEIIDLMKMNGCCDESVGIANENDTPDNNTNHIDRVPMNDSMDLSAQSRNKSKKKKKSKDHPLKSELNTDAIDGVLVQNITQAQTRTSLSVGAASISVVSQQNDSLNNDVSDFDNLSMNGPVDDIGQSRKKSKKKKKSKDNPSKIELSTDEVDGILVRDITQDQTKKLSCDTNLSTTAKKKNIAIHDLGNENSMEKCNVTVTDGEDQMEIEVKKKKKKKKLMEETKLKPVEQEVCNDFINSNTEKTSTSSNPNDLNENVEMKKKSKKSKVKKAVNSDVCQESNNEKNKLDHDLKQSQGKIDITDGIKTPLNGSNGIQVKTENKQSLVGQWGDVNFEQNDRTSKFFRLMGGMKSKNKSNDVASSSKFGGQAAHNAASQEDLYSKLQKQYDSALNIRLSGSLGMGLGFDKPSASKKFYIDKCVNSSVKFDS